MALFCAFTSLHIVLVVLVWQCVTIKGAVDGIFSLFSPRAHVAHWVVVAHGKGIVLESSSCQPAEFIPSVAVSSAPSHPRLLYVTGSWGYFPCLLHIIALFQLVVLGPVFGFGLSGWYVVGLTGNSRLLLACPLPSQEMGFYFDDLVHRPSMVLLLANNSSAILGLGHVQYFTLFFFMVLFFFPCTLVFSGLPSGADGVHLKVLSYYLLHWLLIWLPVCVDGTSTVSTLCTSSAPVPTYGPEQSHCALVS